MTSPCPPYAGCAAKNDFEGHDGIHHDNVYAYMGMGLDNGYGGQVRLLLGGRRPYPACGHSCAPPPAGRHARPGPAGRPRGLLLQQYPRHQPGAGGAGQQQPAVVHRQRLPALPRPLLRLQDGDYSKPICSGRGKNVLGNNSVYSPTGNLTECGMSLAAWQAQVGHRCSSATSPLSARPLRPCALRATTWARPRPPTPLQASCSTKPRSSWGSRSVPCARQLWAN